MYADRPFRSFAILIFWLVATAPAHGEGETISSEPAWIWNPVHAPGRVPNGACFFRCTFDLKKPLKSSLEIAADDSFEVFVNGRSIGKGAEWRHFTKFDVSSQLVEGRNAVAVKVVNFGGGHAGLVARLTLDEETIVSDRTWKCSTISQPKWQQIRFADKAWKSSRELGAWRKTKPWTVAPLPSARRVAAINSPTKPARAEPLEFIDGSEFMLVAAEEEVKTPKRRIPLLLKPIEQSLSLRWLRKNRTGQPKTDRDAIEVNAPKTAISSPHQSTGKSPRRITNPYVQPTETQITTQQNLPTAAATGGGGAMRDPLAGQTTVERLSTRDGFSVEQVLSGDKTGSLISATFNEFGQILAGREKGPLILVIDSDEDGTLDTVRTYCDKVKNCHGILALSGMVFVVADGPEGSGLYRLSDEDRDGDLEETSLLAGFDVTASEHGPHGIVLGPDGKLYVTVGNHATLKTDFSKQSPRQNLYEGDLVPRYEDPGGHANGVQIPGGFILRTDINGKSKELFASGLRNAYDLAFNSEGQLFTYDSDMESDATTTWYRPTRLYHVVPGSEFGWRSGWAKWPNNYIDAIPPVAETGRGSPTGIVFYQHHTYPTEYQNVAFLADWSEGRILTATMLPDGAGYKVDIEVFVEGKPLNVTDVEIGPDGMLYFSTGGRDTRGGIYRVVWNGMQRSQTKTSEVEAALNAPQINSSWGRQAVAASRLKIGRAWKDEITRAVTDTSKSTSQRLQALQLMQWVGPIPTSELLITLSRDDEAAVRRMATYLMSSSKDGQVPIRLLEMLSDPESVVRRQVCESLVRSHRSVPYEYVAPLLGSRDAIEAWAARRLLALDNPNEWQAEALASTDVRTFIQAGVALMSAWPSKERALAIAARSTELMRSYVSDDDFVDMIRLLQITTLRGDLQPSEIPDLVAALTEEFPANDHDIINRELSRLLVRLQATSIKDRFLTHLESDISAPEKLHLATHLRYLNADWSTEEKLRLFKYLTPSPNAGNSVPGYLENVAQDFGKTFNPEEDATFIQRGKDVPSAALQAVLRLPESLSVDQIGDLIRLDGSLDSTDATTKKLKVAILAILARDGKDVSMGHLRNVYDRDPLRRVEVVIGLAEKPDGENWDYLVRSLPVLDGELAKEIMTKLHGVDRYPENAEPYRQVIMTGIRLGDDGGNDAVHLLEYWRGFATTDDTPQWSEALKAWQNWYTQMYPHEPAPELTQSSTHGKWDYEKLLGHLSKSSASQAGSADHGRQVFVDAKCASCHQHGSQGEPMGPNLSTIGNRFLTKEILDSIMYPARVISDQYKAKTLLTDTGQAYTGIVGSGGQNELLVLQVDGTKVRVPMSSVEQTIPSKVSAMPEGLLDSLTIQQITDLMAYLKETPVEQLSEDVKQPLSR